MCVFRKPFREPTRVVNTGLSSSAPKTARISTILKPGRFMSFRHTANTSRSLQIPPKDVEESSYNQGPVGYAYIVLHKRASSSFVSVTQIARVSKTRNTWSVFQNWATSPRPERFVTRQLPPRIARQNAPAKQRTLGRADRDLADAGLTQLL